ncbi:MAG: BMP family ABC transporter substrate-binding protein [Verrucomicrobiota bacterium]
MKPGLGARFAVVIGIFALVVAVGADGAAPASPRLRVTLVLDSAWQVSPFERSAREGLSRAVRNLAVDARVLVEGPKEPLQPVLLSAARQRPDLIIAIPSLDRRAFDTAAQRFPDTRFLALDVPREVFQHRPQNVQGTVFRVEEPSYVAGYLAGLMEERRPGKDVVSSVGGVKVPPVDRFIAGYAAGARGADRTITTLNDYTNDFLDAAKCKRAAREQIARGSGVVFQVAGVCGFGALEAAKEQGVWGIGVDADQSGLGPHILTSVVKRLDVATYSAIRSLVKGTFRTGGNTVFTLANGGVGLGKTSPKVPRAFVDRMNAVKRQIVFGKIRAIPTTVP